MERDQIVGAIAGAAAVVCAALPWGTVFIFEVTGLDGDGVFSAAAGAVGGISALAINRPSIRRWVMAACGAVVTAVGVWHLFFGIGDEQGVSIGLGLYGTVPAGLALGIVGLVGTGSNPPATPAQPGNWPPPT